MSFPESWPERLRTVLLESYGVPLHIALLAGGLSHAVWRVQSSKQSVVVKRCTQPREGLFYAKIAPTLVALDVPIPRLEWSGRDAETFWLVLEDIPTPLPRVRWSADQEMLTVLQRLHQRLPLNLAFSPFEPSWSDAMTNEALACFPSAQARRLAPILQDLQLSHQMLFTPRCWISGDPNPTNWGLRDDGTLVLYDWERFGKATPAIDLAITVPGLGDRAVFQAVATTYLGLESRSSSLITQEMPFFTQEIVVAKVWSIIEYLSRYPTGAIARSPQIDILMQQIPAWVEKIISSRG